jgi:hypothetical protein
MANIISVSNPVYVTEDGTAIDCILQIDSFPVPVPFTAYVNDVEEHGRQIYAKIVAGEYGAIAPYVAPVVEQPQEPTVDSVGGAPSVI